MVRKCLRLGLTIGLLLTTTVLCNAATTEPGFQKELHYQVGWQISQSASGFSIKIPVVDQFYVQPLFSFSMNQQPGTSGSTANGHFALGLRGIARLPERGNFLPYVGAGWGHSENFAGNSIASATITKGNTGIEAFMGIEYQKYVLRPTLEIGLGSYNRADGSYYAGTTLNLGLMYSF